VLIPGQAPCDYDWNRPVAQLFSRFQAAVADDYGILFVNHDGLEKPELTDGLRNLVDAPPLASPQTLSTGLQPTHFQFSAFDLHGSSPHSGFGSAQLQSLLGSAPAGEEHIRMYPIAESHRLFKPTFWATWLSGE
jgi:hypothetical protein